MTKVLDKDDILEDAGFKYNFDRDIYVNRRSKKIFSLEAVEDNDEIWLNNKIKEKNYDWIFYFNGAVLEDIKNELLREYS